MAGTVQLIHGDLFDGPADLVVLPCSTTGSYTPFVAERLRAFAIPAPRAGRELGDVDYEQLAVAAHVAQYAALAASVLDEPSGRMSSSAEAIERIASSLARFTCDHTGVRVVNAPLLGAGAGGLPHETVVHSLRHGFTAHAAAGAILNIYVLLDDVYRMLLGSFTQEPAPEHAAPETPPRVLISYAHSTPDHQAWVDGLYRHLRENGIEARIDSYSLDAGGDIPQWMTNEITLADRVLLICDEVYCQRADGKHGGVGWETQIIQGAMFQEMYEPDHDPATGKYVPILRVSGGTEQLPAYLRTKRYVPWPPGSDEQQCRRSLLDELLHRRRDIPLGRLPVAGP
jgi:hypothetical protein